MRRYIDPDEVPDADLVALATKSFASFAHPAVTPVVPIAGGLHILELFHGPTLAFKDVALQFLGNLFEYFLQRRPQLRPLTVLGATSGDTGSAAIYGLRGRAGVEIVVLHPRGRISPVQQLQMTTVLDANVHNVAVPGTFDDCQNLVKELFGDVAFKRRYGLTAINSINWARILAQTVYYFAAFFQLQRAQPAVTEVRTVRATTRRSATPGADRFPGARAPQRGWSQVNVVVPTGNFGDVLAGYYARAMGLPIRVRRRRRPRRSGGGRRRLGSCWRSRFHPPPAADAGASDEPKRHPAAVLRHGVLQAAGRGAPDALAGDGHPGVVQL